MKRTLGLGLLLGTSMILSCGGDSDSGGGGAATGPAIDQIPALLAQTYCDIMEQCMGGVLDIYLGGQDCKTKTLPGVEDKDFAATKDAVAAGRIKYDGSKVDACIADMKKQGCAVGTTRNTAPCNEVLAGTVEVGSSCTISGECKGDAYCKGDTCPGVCTPREASGVACRFDDACRSGMRCINKTCGTPAGVGGTCTDGGNECDITMICMGADASKNQAGTCKPITDVFKAKVGEDCDFTTSVLCEPGVSCVLQAVANPLPFKCSAVLASGAACKVGIPNPCPVAEYCKGVDLKANPPVIDGTCSASPAAGEPCANTYGSRCQADAICDESGVCRVPQRIGAACTSDKACYSENCVNGTCKAWDDCTL